MSLDSFQMNSESIKVDGSDRTESAENSALSVFSSAFLEEGKQQIKAVLQLGGGTFETNNHSIQPQTSLESHAQMLGKGLADALPILVTAAGVKFGLGKLAGEGVNLTKPALGLSMRESGSVGFISGALFQPTDDDKASDVKSLILDRAKNGVAGAVTFTAMNMASAEISAAGEKITWDFGRKLVANSAVNGLLSGRTGWGDRRGSQLCCYRWHPDFGYAQNRHINL